MAVLSPRVASTTFTYIKPLPIFLWTAICSTCRTKGSCMQAWLCGDGSKPDVLTQASPSLRVPSTGSTLIANIRNWPKAPIDDLGNVVISSECLPRDMCGITIDPPTVGYVYIRSLLQRYIDYFGFFLKCLEGNQTCSCLTIIFEVQGEVQFR